MRPQWLLLISLMLLLVACQPAGQQPTPFVLPTLLQFPTETIVYMTPTPEAVVLQGSATPSPLPPDTLTPTPTNTAEPSATTFVQASATPTLRPLIPTSTPQITPFLALTDAQYADISFEDAFDLLHETPLVVFPADHVVTIYQRGRLRGLRDDFLLSVGDCNSESGWYLESLLDDEPPTTGVDAAFYEDQQVKSTISRYQRAFAFKGQSVNSGLNAASVLDPLWASKDVCPVGTSPLTCDYQLTESFASLIMFGANDINVMNTAGYEMAMRDIIETTLDRDIIPILSTFSVRPIEGSSTYAIGVRFNAVLVRLAAEYQIPLVNFWRATRTLPDGGILTDNAHLTVAGFNIRNQLTIEILTQMQLEILSNGSQS